jgi:hypothetical protein
LECKFSLFRLFKNNYCGIGEFTEFLVALDGLTFSVGVTMAGAADSCDEPVGLAEVTLPMIVNFKAPCLSLFCPVENVTLTSFVNGPGLPAELYPTEIFAVLPGSIS